jgi:hypothetical protein
MMRRATLNSITSSIFGCALVTVVALSSKHGGLGCDSSVQEHESCWTGDDNFLATLAQPNYSAIVTTRDVVAVCRVHPSRSRRVPGCRSTSRQPPGGWRNPPVTRSNPRLVGTREVTRWDISQSPRLVGFQRSPERGPGLRRKTVRVEDRFVEIPGTRYAKTTDVQETGARTSYRFRFLDHVR